MKKIHTAGKKGNTLFPELIKELNKDNGTNYQGAVAILHGMMWKISVSDSKGAENLGYVSSKLTDRVKKAIEENGLIIAGDYDLEILKKKLTGYEFEHLKYADS